MTPNSPYLQHKRLVKRLGMQRQRERRNAKGLTSRGTARKYTLHRELDPLRGNDRKIARERIYRQAWNAKGLSSHGRTPLKRGPNQIELAWRQFRATMVLPPPAWWEAS